MPTARAACSAANASGRAQAAYETERRDDGKLPATYEVVYGHAWAVEGRRRQPQDVHTFPLEKLRRR